MAINPKVVPRKPQDRGTAQALMDVTRRIRTLESKAGVVGSGATVTGAMITTSDTDPRVFLKGVTSGGSIPTTAGFYATDSSGNAVIQIIPGLGLIMTTGTSAWNRVEWLTGAVLDGYVHVQRFTSGGQTGNKSKLDADSPDTTHSVSVGPQAINSAGAATQNRVYATVDAVTAVVLDGNSNGIWPRGIGFWNVTPPGSQAAHAVTLADVISILTNYGLCA